MKVKEWKYDDMMKKVSSYGDLWMNIDVERDHEKFDTPAVDENGYITFTCKTEIVKETEKAIRVSFAQGAWTEWFPKSAVIC